jgi:hypothetical protein
MAAELDNALYEDIYRHLICQIEGILDPVLSFEFSVRVSHNDGSISFRVPFWLPPPSPESLRWLTTAEEQQALRQAFAARLQRELKRFIPSQLREFLLERLDVERYKPPIPERLKRYLRGSAGRPEFDQPPLSRAEKKILLEIRSAVDVFQDTVKKRPTKIRTDREIRSYLRESIDTEEKSHLEKHLRSFLRYSRERVPRRRYQRGRNDTQLTTAKLAEAEEWNIVEIAADLARYEILVATGKLYAKRVLADALRRKQKNVAKIGGNKS